MLARLAGLRQAPIDQKRAPHKPLLLLWLLGQFAATGRSAASYQQAEELVSQLINDSGPPVAGPAAARQRAAMPFVHLERDLLLASFTMSVGWASASLIVNDG
ncbi:MAG: hypothetical protein ACLP8X_20795 [Streptosporangiaceae bacterium]